MANNSIPLNKVIANSIPEAFFKAGMTLLKKHIAIRTQYDRKVEGEFIDPPSFDSSFAIQVLNPFEQPRYPIVSYVEIGKYIAETCWGVKNHLIIPPDELKEKLWAGEFDERKDTRWPYTYNQRIYEYPTSKGSLNQVDVMLNRLAKDSYTKRAVATTLVPEIDQFLKGDLPCLQEIWLRCTEDKKGTLYLHMQTVWRSRDGYKGWPDNALAMTFWQRMWAEQLSNVTRKTVKVGSYTDFSNSFHFYGEDISGKELEKQFSEITLDEFIKRSFTSEKARDLLVIPQLEDLIAETHWNFPQGKIELMQKEIEKIKNREYLP